MSQNVENVNTETENEVESVQPPPTKTKMVILCLVAMEVLLIGIIIFLLYYTQPSSGVPSGKVQGDSRNISEELPRIDLRFGEIASETGRDNASKISFCKTPECFHTAARIMDSIDFTKQPCENFYDYACAKMDIQEEEEIDIFAPKYYIGENKPQFLKKFKRFYESCVSYEDKFDYKARVENAKSLLEQVGIIQLSNTRTEDFNLTKFIADMILYNSMPLFDVNIDVNSNDATYIMKLMLPDQTSISLDHWSSLSETKRKCLRVVENISFGKELNTTHLYEKFSLCEKDYSDYLDSISTSLQELYFSTNVTEKEEFARIEEIRMFIEFEILSMFDQVPTPPNLQELKIKHNFSKVKVGYLEEHFPMIQWGLLFELLTNKGISNETVIQLYNEDYFKRVFKKLSAGKHTPLHNAFLAILANSLYVNTVLPSHKHTREDYCKELSRQLMPDIVNHLYRVIVKPKVLAKKNEVISSMYHNLSSRFIKSLEKQEWLDDQSKSSIIQKLNNIKLVLFDRGDLESERIQLEASYQSLDIVKGDFQQNHFALIQFRKRQIFELHGEKSTAENIYRHFVDVSKEEPFFFYPNNLICIPFGLYKHIRDLPEYLIESRVGFALAKIIGNALDSIGMRYGVNLTETVKTSYEEFAEETKDMLILIDPISFGDKNLFFNLNNGLSESERIADNTAMKLLTESLPSFQAQEYLSLIPPGFTKEKLFFLHLVQGMCRKMKVTDFMVEAFESQVLPPQLRVASFLGSSGEFLKTFGCKPGSGMARIEEGLQFPYLPKS